MNNIVRAYLAGMPKDVIDWLNGLRNRNPLIGSKGAQNTNSILCEIGKNIIVDTILDAHDEALHPSTPKERDIDGSDLMVSPVSE